MNNREQIPEKRGQRTENKEQSQRKLRTVNREQRTENK